MPRSARFYCLIAALVAVPFAAQSGTARDDAQSAQAKAKLAEVRQRIAELTARVGEELKQRDELHARLRAADLDITTKRRELDGFRSAQLAAERRRGQLLADQSRLQNVLDERRTALAGQVRAAYMIGRQEWLKLMLNQDDPSRAGRMLTFYGYFIRERAAQVEEIRERVDEYRELVAQVDRANMKLETLRAASARDVTELRLARQNRAEALAVLARQVESGSQQLAQLKREEQAEESLIADLARVMEDYPIEAQRNFQELRGKLPWPVQGRMRGGLQRTGVLIEAARGAKVRAPYYGRVVYADWLQGLGLLIILGHKGNYMTLYGHAEALYKAAGDWVAPGDVIAALSDAGGTAPQLYFEIRDGRKPVDPKAWLKTTP
ncbi:MAG: peptidoglycan DD-metalloendopeptidase family protein [Pseudomonadota bacterium]|nr:peptidoglycan DD-metalloendopeptidase family protein [Pseudomonadota bacterium]